VDPGESFNSALFSELLSLLQKMSLAGVTVFQNIFNALFDILTATVQLFDKFLDSVVSLPIIDTVWQWFQGLAGVSTADASPLTVGGLCELASRLDPAYSRFSFRSWL
jgi:hypothetical protein